MRSVVLEEEVVDGMVGRKGCKVEVRRKGRGKGERWLGRE